MKKTFGAFVLPLGAMLLSACGGGGGDKIKLRIGFWPEPTETREVAMYNLWKEAFEAENPEYTIIADPYTYDTTTIMSKFNGGTLPTVFQTWFTEPLKLKNLNIIRPITDQLGALGWDEMMDDGMKETLTFDGDIYGVPRDGYGLGLLLNMKTFYDNGLLEKDGNGKYILYDEKGKPLYPTSFEEIYEASLTISEYDDTKGILICSANKNGGWQFNNIAWNFGANFQTQDESGKWVAHLDSPESISALSWIQKMKQDGLLLNSPSVTYDEWYSSIGSKVAMAIVGSDVLHLAATSGGVNMDDLAFLPMPTGDGTHHTSLYGGTPFVFNKNATDAQVEGILKFFDYIGRSPTTSERNVAAIVDGYEVSKAKNQPVIPKIMPWKNEDYLEMAKRLETEYLSVDMGYYSDFFGHIDQNKRSEEPYYTQEMYEFLDLAIQSVLTAPDTASPSALLTTANAKLQALFDQNLNH